MDKREYWIGKFAAQKASGQPRKQFCEANQLNLHTCTYWKQKLFGKRKSSSKKKKFVSVKVKSPARPSSSYELEFPSGLKIRFDNNFDSTKLKQIIESVM